MASAPSVSVRRRIIVGMNTKLTKIAIFYDGSYFSHVSNYYSYYHSRRERISVGGIHHYIRRYIAEQENVELRFCQVVEAHYFRGRYPAHVVEGMGILKGERQFEDVLMHHGITTHFMPMSDSGEKGVDVALALEAFERVHLHQYDVSVLIAGDGDYVPLVRKLHMLGSRVMVCGWNFEFVDERGQYRSTFTSKSLLQEASYPVMMTDVIQNYINRNDPILDSFFIPRSNACFEENAESVLSDTSWQPSDVKSERLAGVFQVGQDDEFEEAQVAVDGARSHAKNDAQRDLSTDNDAVSEQADIGLQESSHLGEGPKNEVSDSQEEKGSQTQAIPILCGEIVLLNQGWGFLAPDNGEVDIFFHYADLIGTDFEQLKVGDRLSFTLGNNERGLIAKTLVRI